MFSRVSSLVVALLALSFFGCDCKGAKVDPKFGVVRVVWRDATGERQLNRDATYDFGNALSGERKELVMTIRNDGDAILTLSDLAFVSGDEVSIAAAATATSAFDVEFTKDLNIAPSESKEFNLGYTPKALKGTYESILKLTTSGTRVEDAEAKITLRGTGEKGSCDLPSEIDFGNTPIGETLSLSLPYQNSTTLPATGFAGDLTGTDSASFGYVMGTPHPMVPVMPMSTTNVEFNFSPTEKRAYSASVKVKGPGECPEQTVTIKGVGADCGLEWTPSLLDYGGVAPGFESVKEVVFTNCSNAPITLSNIISTNTADFYRLSLPGEDATKFVVPGGNVPTPLKVVCNPSRLGALTGNLTFNTPLRKTPMGTIELRAKGGGPKIKVSPRQVLGFGRVGFFPGNSNFTVTRKVNIQNVGTDDPMNTLKLGTVAMDGTPGILPLFELNPTGTNTAPGEFSISFGSGMPYNPTTGLRATPGSNFTDLVITLKPVSMGAKTATLTIYSNDSSEPEINIQITADAQQLPPCNYKVDPPQANFGLVTPPATKSLPITITNLGTTATDICYFSGIDLSAGTHPAYSIVGGPIVEKELQPLQSMQVVVKVAPVGPVPTVLQTLSGALTFNVTSPTAPQGSVQLRTSVGTACLVVTPDPLDFGTIKKGCNSPERTFNVYNTCATAVSIRGFSVQAPAGQPPGGPDCAGAVACPEFRLTMSPNATPAAPIVMAPGAAPLTFKVKYSPIDFGSDQGAVAIDAVQGQSITYLVGLQGNGDATGQQVDTFMQDLQPKADILLVIDDSCSMQDKQNSLAANFRSFIQYAVSANVDYQIGITSTSPNAQTCVPGFGCMAVGSKAAEGKLYLDTVTNRRILKPTTPMVEATFARMVNLGTNGDGQEQGLETALQALTPPRIVTENAGFLRTDANLAVVVITDADDQSPKSITGEYIPRLVNVKGFNRLSQFTFSTIGPYRAAGAPSGCTYDDTSVNGAPRYDNVVNYTSGVRDEICSTSWNGTLQNLGRTVFGFRTQFYLINSPDTTMGRVIEVKIDGMVIPSTQWSYDGASKSIKFLPTATPGPGQTLSVTYFTACM